MQCSLDKKFKSKWQLKMKKTEKLTPKQDIKQLAASVYSRVISKQLQANWGRVCSGK